MSFVLVATICAGIFAGAAIYIAFVEHPARSPVVPPVALREFAPSYRRATIMQAALAIVGPFRRPRGVVADVGSRGSWSVGSP